MFSGETHTNIYRYSEPAGVVVVRTEETWEDLEVVDTVLASTLPIFQVGERITYNLLR